jgi:hypothetical protein
MSAGKSGTSLNLPPDGGPSQGKAKGRIRRRLSRNRGVQAGDRETRSSRKQPTADAADATTATGKPTVKSSSGTNGHPAESTGPAGRAERLRKRKRNAILLRLVIALIFLLPPLLGVVRWHSKSQAPGLIGSLWGLAVFWLVVLAILEVAGLGDKNPRRSIYGFLNIAIGSDGRVSTSKTVAAVWTAAFASALVFLSGMVLFGHQPAAGQFTSTGSNWDAYLLLLGGPYAAAVLAKGIVSAKTQDDPSNKSQLPTASGTANPASTTVDGAPSPKDVVAGDTGTLDLVDTQFSVFSLVAIFYFVGAFVASLIAFADGTGSVALPAIPSALLGLTSLAALTYTGNKAVQTQGVRVATFHPNPAAPGAPVVATLVNLPQDATQGNVSVIITSEDKTHPPIAPSKVDTSARTVSFTAPTNSGNYLVAFLAPDTYTTPASLTVSSSG